MNRNPTQDNEDRIRRARSWCQQAERATVLEERFLFFWIAFDAAYGQAQSQDKDKKATASEARAQFIERIVAHDAQKKLYASISEMLDGPVRVLMQNKYIYEPFWEAHRENQGNEWEKGFKDHNKRTYRAWVKGKTGRMLDEILWRLYTLRNQMVHGGMTYGGSWGQDQLRDSNQILSKLVPLIIEIMSADIAGNPGTEEWGMVAYPRFEESPQ